MLELKKEKYIDVKFSTSSTIYTYICPESLSCSVGDELRIISNGKVEDVEVVKEPYRSVIKTDKNYVLLELYNDAENDVEDYEFSKFVIKQYKKLGYNIFADRIAACTTYANEEFKNQIINKIYDNMFFISNKISDNVHFVFSLTEPNKTEYNNIDLNIVYIEEEPLDLESAIECFKNIYLFIDKYYKINYSKLRITIEDNIRINNKTLLDVLMKSRMLEIVECYKYEWFVFKFINTDIFKCSEERRKKILLFNDIKNGVRIENFCEIEDRDVIVTALRKTPDYYRELSDVLKNDMNLIKITFQKGWGISYGEIPEKIRNDKNKVLELIKDGCKILPYINDEFKNDKEFIIECAKYTNAILNYFPEKFIEDKDTILKCLKNIQNFQPGTDGISKLLLDSNLFRDDEDVICELVRSCYSDRLQLSDRLQKDKKFYEKLLSIDGSYLKFASEEIKSDEKFVRIAIKTCPNIIEIGNIPDEHLHNRDLMKLAAESGCHSKVIVKYFPDDEELGLIATKNWGYIYGCLPDALKNNKRIALEACKSYAPSILKDAPESIKRDREFILKAIKVGGVELNFAGILSHSVFDEPNLLNDLYKDDYDVVLAACTNKGYNYRSISDRLKKDVSIMEAAAVTLPEVLENLPKDKITKELILKTNNITTNRLGESALPYIPEIYKNDFDIVFEAFKNVPISFRDAGEKFKSNYEYVKKLLEWANENHVYVESILINDEIKDEKLLKMIKENEQFLFRDLWWESCKHEAIL